MWKVVSDTSPLVSLAGAGYLHLLERLYQQVAIPEAVLQELKRCPGFVGGVQFDSLPWLRVVPVSNRVLVDALLSELHLGEAEAIALAVEIGADLLLIDERIGRQVAERMGLRFLGVLGVLLDAKEQGIVDRVKPVLDAMIVRSGFWIAEDLYARVLREAGEPV